MTRSRSDVVKRMSPILCVGVLASLALVLTPARTEAIPAFARQFGVNCTTCHTPVPPRLNNVGITFKRMGYRMPDADDNGRLILKEKSSRGAFDDASLIASFLAESHREESTTFKVDELMAMAGGAVGHHLSYTAGAMWEEGEFGLETLEGQVLLGRPTMNFTARFGLLKPLLWEKGSETALGVTTSLLMATPVPVGEFAGSPLGDTRLGIEGAVNFNHLGEGGASRNAFVAVSLFDRNSPGAAAEGGMGAPTSEAQPADTGLKDVMAQAMYLFGQSNTVGVLWSHGRVTGIGAEGFANRSDRWAVMGNYRFPFGTDLLAAVGFGRDVPTAMDLGTIKSRGWFVEVDQAIGSRTVALVRYDRFEPDRSRSDLTLSGPTVSLTHHLLDHLLLTAEYQGLQRDGETRSQDLFFRAIVAY